MKVYEYEVDYPACYYIEGAFFRGDLFKAIPGFESMFNSMEEAKAAAVSVLKGYAVIRVMKEELLLGRVLTQEEIPV